MTESRLVPLTVIARPPLYGHINRRVSGGVKSLVSIETGGKRGKVQHREHFRPGVKKVNIQHKEH